jgi:hypothetical protein
MFGRDKMISNKIKVVLTASTVFMLSVTFVSVSPVVLSAAGDWNASGTIANSPHNLSALNTDGNAEICVYCHTPHGAGSAFTGAPLWNKDANTSIAYRMYGATANDTNGSTIAGTDTLGKPASPSLACLSCHDGVSAIDSIVNAPGSGMNSKTGTKTIQTNTSTVDNGNLGGTYATLSAVDMTNDHPVSIEYIPGRAGLRATTTVLADTNDKSINTGLWVGATNVSDLLRSDRVECGSCHDPHLGYSADQSAKQVNFLRYTNTKSYLCVGCHAK